MSHTIFDKPTFPDLSLILWMNGHLRQVNQGQLESYGFPTRKTTVLDLDKFYLVSGQGVLETMTQTAQSQQRGIQMTDAALKHVLMLREKQEQDLCLRVGVRGGGCSGMSYTMNFEDPTNIQDNDEVYDYDGFKVVCDPKSMLYLYGLVLDYSDALIGGGFQFTNPNAEQTCGCGKSFSA